MLVLRPSQSRPALNMSHAVDRSQVTFERLALENIVDHVTTNPGRWADT